MEINYFNDEFRQFRSTSFGDVNWGFINVRGKKKLERREE